MSEGKPREQRARPATEEEIEAYFRAYERTPLTDDELSFIRWSEQHFGETDISAEDPSDRGA